MPHEIVNTILIVDGVPHKLVVSQPTGAGQLFHVLIDNYYTGCITTTSQGWMPFVTTPILTGDDLGVIVDMIRELYPD